jgi:CRISP-associated protein Cas1
MLRIRCSRWAGFGVHDGPENAHATHPINAMLNYAYRVLETQVRIASVAAGLDPAIGYLHTCRSGRMALVYDLMEPLRPKVDSVILNFIHCQTFTSADFSLAENGVCMLTSLIAEKIATMISRQQQTKNMIEALKQRLESICFPG